MGAALTHLVGQVLLTRPHPRAEVRSGMPNPWYYSSPYYSRVSPQPP